MNGKNQELSNWPTPTVNCVEGGEQSDRVERSASGGYVLRKKNKPNATYGAKLSDATLFEERQKQENWPTPTTQEIEHKNMVLTKTGRRLTKDGSNSHSLNLTDKVNQENWPTPTKNDMKDTWNGERGETLVSKMKEKRSGKLNPDWCEQLMGLPVGWTKINDTDDRISRLMAIGNGVVPQTAALAWEILNAKLMTTKTED